MQNMSRCASSSPKQHAVGRRAGQGRAGQGRAGQGRATSGKAKNPMSAELANTPSHIFCTNGMISTLRCKTSTVAHDRQQQEDCIVTAGRSRRLQSYIDLEGVIDGPLSSSQGTNHGYTKGQPPGGQLPPPHLIDHTPNCRLLQRMTRRVRLCSSSKAKREKQVAGALLKTVPLIGAFCRHYLGI